MLFFYFLFWQSQKSTPVIAEFQVVHAQRPPIQSHTHPILPPEFYFLWKHIFSAPQSPTCSVSNLKTNVPAVSYNEYVTGSDRNKALSVSSLEEHALYASNSLDRTKGKYLPNHASSSSLPNHASSSSFQNVKVCFCVMK